MTKEGTGKDPPIRWVNERFFRSTEPGRAATDIPRMTHRDKQRYTRRGDLQPLYASDLDVAAVAETLRHVEGLIPMKRQLSTLVVSGPVLDVSTAEGQAAYGVTEGQLRSDELRHCRRMTDEAKRLTGVIGVLAPSAAHTGAKTIVVSLSTWRSTYGLLKWLTCRSASWMR